jgi:hypothetical protein
MAVGVNVGCGVGIRAARVAQAVETGRVVGRAVGALRVAAKVGTIRRVAGGRAGRAGLPVKGITTDATANQAVKAIPAILLRKGRRFRC